MKAVLKNYQQAPRKVRLIANLIRGMDVNTAQTELTFLSKKGAMPMKTLVESAIANAKQNDGIESDHLYIKEIEVDQGVTLKRWRPRAFGRAFPINRRTSHVRIVLGNRAPQTEETASESVEAES